MRKIIVSLIKRVRIFFTKLRACIRRVLCFTKIYSKRIVRCFIAVFITPQSCICCGKRTYSYPVCHQCIKKYLRQFEIESRCNICGRQLISEQNICTVCRKEPLLTHVSSVFPIHEYLLWKKDLLYSWKIAEDRSLSVLFARIAFEALGKIYPNAVVIPVPPRPGKIRNQGWDQIEELCTYMSTLYGVNVLRLLSRTEKKQQKKLDRSERLSHLGKSYVVNWEMQKKVSIPKEAVLLDDIMTTGVTLESCARALIEVGVQKVYALTLFNV